MSVKISLESSNPTEERVLTYLAENASEVLIQKINAGKKTLAGALDYAKDEAQKMAKGESCIYVDDATVFGWIVHFFEEDHIKEPVKKPKAAQRLPSGVKQKQKKPKAKSASSTQTSMLESLFNGDKEQK